MSAKTEKDLVMEELDALDIQYNKRTSLQNLKELLDKHKPPGGEHSEVLAESDDSPDLPESEAGIQKSVKGSQKGYLKNEKTGAVFEQTKALKARGDLVPATFEDYRKFKGI